MILNYISYLTGKFSRLEHPAWLVRGAITGYAKLYKVNLAETAHPSGYYRSLSAFFSRELKPDARPLPADRDRAILSPVDGTLRSIGVVKAGSILQVKGLEYAVKQLIGDEADAKPYEGGVFLNFYLSPSDYHRVHSPISGQIVRSKHIPGSLWPVNDWTLKRRQGLFAENERLITWIESKAGPVAVVMVGALNVGSMRVVFDDWRTNARAGSAASVKHYATPYPIMAGQELGRFEMGSAVVILCPTDSMVLAADSELSIPRKITYGTPLARFGN